MISTKVPLFDLARVLEPLKPELHAALERCLQHGIFVLGPEVLAFEKQLGQYVGADHVVGLSSGTDALLATLMALDLPKNSEILTTPFTFIASATSILRADLRPVFVDIAPGKFHPDLADYERAWTSNTRGILNVHLFGEAQPLADVAALCEAKGGVLVEDCAQAIGARARDKRHVGRAGVAGTLSFFPAKNLGTLGDGGAFFSDDADLAKRVREKRQHGCSVRYQHTHLGGNFRLDALHAAFLQVLLPQLDHWLELRAQNAAAYDQALAPLARAKPELLQLPVMTEGHAWNQYVIRSPKRDHVKAVLDAAGIGNAIYYPSALHTQGALAAAGPFVPLPYAEKACEEVLALPIYPGLTQYERARVIEVVAQAFAC